MEAIRSSETSVFIRATRCHLPEDDNHQIFCSLCAESTVTRLAIETAQCRYYYSVDTNNYITEKEMHRAQPARPVSEIAH
jgi:hypothetical protein